MRAAVTAIMHATPTPSTTRRNHSRHVHDPSTELGTIQRKHDPSTERSAAWRGAMQRKVREEAQH